MAEDSHGKAVPTEDDAEDDPDGQPPAASARTPNLSRRSYLVGSVVAVGGVAGLSTAASGASDAVDVVEFGADPTGSEPINDVLTEALGQYDRVTFPPGEYLVSGDLEVGGDGWEVTGVDATLLLDDGGLDLSGSGWTFDGFEIDFRGQDGFGKCLLRDSNWTFGNVVFRGTRQVDEKAPLLVPWVGDGSSALMHDVYAHEGNADGDEDGKAKLMWQDGAMAGTLQIERMWAEHWSENTIYASDMEGDLIVRDSYFRNTNAGCLRASERVEARGCTFVADGPIPGQWNEERKGATEFKGVWCNFNRGSGNGVAVVEDCDFYYTHESGVGSGVELDGPGDSVRIDDSRFHSTFPVRMIDGAGEDMEKGGSGNVISGGFEANVSSIGVTSSSEPATDGTPPLPEPPALGRTPNGGDPGGTEDADGTEDSGGTGDDSGNWSRLRIEGDGDSSTGAEFTFTVSGDLRHLTPDDPVLQDGHGVDGSTATEDVWSEREEYEFTGSVTEFQVDGPATLHLDGERVTVEELVDGGGSTGEPPEYRLEIVAPEHVEYRFSATGEISMVTDNGDNASEAGNDVVSENGDGSWTAEGLTGNGYGDTYDVVGEALEFDVLAGDCVLYRDGEEVTVDELLGGDQPEPTEPLPNTIAFEGSGDGRGEYSFSVTGDLEKHESLGTRDPGDAIDGGTASGVVDGSDVDAYRFEGDLSSINLTGSATISLVPQSGS